jgi:hypothetical protein
MQREMKQAGERRCLLAIEEGFFLTLHPVPRGTRGPAQLVYGVHATHIHCWCCLLRAAVPRTADLRFRWSGGLVASADTVLIVGAVILFVHCPPRSIPVVSVSPMWRPASTVTVPASALCLSWSLDE